MEECRQQLAAMQETLTKAGESLDVAGLAAEKEELEKKMGAPDFWDDVEAANKAN